jgi:SAM-dependent methyltransferase
MTDSSASITGEQIARYYDRNTPRFLRYGGSGEAAALHRQIWGPGVASAGQAFLYLNRYTVQAIAPCLRQDKQQALILDLGCGAGGTTTWLAQQLGVKVIGITNSQVQHRLAGERAARLGLEGQCRFIRGDFMNLPALDPADAVVAIESLVHAANAGDFFAQAASSLAPGGRLVVCDDFLSPEACVPGAPRQAGKWLQRFTSGWHLNSLIPMMAAISLAEQAGLVLIRRDDLTPYLRLYRPPVLGLMKRLTRLPLPFAYWHNLSGGTALQVCVQNKWTQYLALVWEKSS